MFWDVVWMIGIILSPFLGVLLIEQTNLAGPPPEGFPAWLPYVLAAAVSVLLACGIILPFFSKKERERRRRLKELETAIYKAEDPKERQRLWNEFKEELLRH